MKHEWNSRSEIRMFNFVLGFLACSFAYINCLQTNLSAYFSQNLADNLLTILFLLMGIVFGPIKKKNYLCSLIYDWFKYVLFFNILFITQSNNKSSSEQKFLNN